jgi:hypothetical protein
MTLTAKILKAAADGKITLSSLDDGHLFSTVAEYLEYCSDEALRGIAVRFDLIADDAGDINEMTYQANRARARFAGIKGA